MGKRIRFWHKLLEVLVENLPEVINFWIAGSLSFAFLVFGELFLAGAVAGAADAAVDWRFQAFLVVKSLFICGPDEFLFTIPAGNG